MTSRECDHCGKEINRWPKTKPGTVHVDNCKEYFSNRNFHRFGPLWFCDYNCACNFFFHQIKDGQ